MTNATTMNIPASPFPQRDLDLVIWGVTGFTGKLALSYILGDTSQFHSFPLQRNNSSHRKPLKYAIAGRNADKLAQLQPYAKAIAPENCPTEIIVCDSADTAAIDNFSRRTKVVLGLAGPFASYSDAVVASCVKHGTHWVDISGEIGWHRTLLDRFEMSAKSTGACIVSHCGYDSIPSDVGVYLAVNALKKGGSAGVNDVTCYQLGNGAISGGTLATGLVPTKLSGGVLPSDPFLLGGSPACGPRQDDLPLTDSYLDKRTSLWAGPFMMAEINRRVVRRSNHLLRYGRSMLYREVSIYPSEKSANKAAKSAKNPPPPSVVRRLISQGRLPKPGDGPAPERRRKSQFLTVVVAEDSVGRSSVVTLRGGDCGYEETAKMAVESALTLVYGICHDTMEVIPGIAEGGGFLTPVACMGMALVRRLQNAGIEIQVSLSDYDRSPVMEQQEAGKKAKGAILQFGKAINSKSKL